MMRMTYLLLLFITLFPRAASGEAFDVDTYLRMHDASEISVSPDGQFIAYTLYERDLEQDLATTSVWMIPTAGGPAIPMTTGDGNSYMPKWSPDNRFLSILSDRGDQPSQVWMLDRRGGDAQPLTELKQGVTGQLRVVSHRKSDITGGEGPDSGRLRRGTPTQPPPLRDR